MGRKNSRYRKKKETALQQDGHLALRGMRNADHV